MKAVKKHLLWFVTTVVCIILDQLTKWLAVKYLTTVATVPLIEGALHLTYVENTGASFGMLKDHRWVFMTVSVVMIIGIVVFLAFQKKIPTMMGLSLGMILGGGIGNMIDRIMLGYVVDFIDFRLINFAVFNGADSFICVGAAILFVVVLKTDTESDKKKRTEKTGSKAEENKTEEENSDVTGTGNE